MGVAFGLAAALCWGLADYCAAVASRAIGSPRVVLGYHLLATALLAIAVAATGALDGLAPTDLLDFVWIGALGALSYLTFYRALEIGPISSVSPVVSAYAAVSVVLAVIVLGESLGAVQVAAIAVVMLGTLLASADLRRAHRSSGARPRRQRPPRALALVAALAVLDTVGFAAFNVGAERAETSIVSAASAPYAVVPIAAGVLFLHERPAPIQWLGVAAVIGGVVLLGVFS